MRWTEGASRSIYRTVPVLLYARRVNWQNRAHFVAMAARAMRRVLVDAAR